LPKQRLIVSEQHLVNSEYIKHLMDDEEFHDHIEFHAVRQRIPGARQYILRLVNIQP